MNAPAPKTMLIVEDDVGLRESLTMMAEASGYEVRGCDTAKEAFDLAVSFKPTLIFCDVHLAQGDGRKVLARLREDKVMSDCQFVLMTGDWVGAPQSTSVAFAADAYLAKPFSLPEFLACMETRYQQANL
jgi:two-component system sensor histidine kinase/response regulator